MTWNYRIIKHDDKGGYYALHEVYYNDDGSLAGYTEDPIEFVCGLDEGSQGIVRSLRMAWKDAKRHPPLEAKDFDTAKIDAS